MRPEELRIGNLFGLSESNKTEVAQYLEETLKQEYFPICAIEGTEVRLFIEEELEFSYSDLIPIPLTEEWILKFGFINNDGDYEIEIGRQGFRLVLAQDTDWLLLYRDDIGCNYNALIFIDYIHQLQNLYYALTGEELKLKL